MSSKSRIQAMLDQEYDTEVDDKWLTVDDLLNSLHHIDNGL